MTPHTGGIAVSARRRGPKTPGPSRGARNSRPRHCCSQLWPDDEFNFVLWSDTNRFLSQIYPSSSTWTYAIAGYRAYYDSAFTTPFFIQGITEHPSNPNLGRPDQHQALDPMLSPAPTIYADNSFFACANYWFPYTTVQLQIGYMPTTEGEDTNIPFLDNTFDPFFIKQSKSTDSTEIWQVQYYYSAIVLAPSVFKNNLIFPAWNDIYYFYNTMNNYGYIVNAMEGNDAVLNISEIDDGDIVIIAGPLLYSDSIPNSISHGTTTASGYGADPSEVNTRVKVVLKSPVNWHKINKYDSQEL